ncbi:hypothetical protein DY926_07950 [Komagataeibacter melaceti]|uniref:Uncharacterized protein n=1 Tax=Komagataeibacter melaceti TaxID=2766577 RepID=A0A371Z0U9_9PROT|nr:hypothetical protein [Komagataeibacter melaceti]RFD20124.1 hypothetical protein DY926_07950 [Komagataeibacter melaceti]
MSYGHASRLTDHVMKEAPCRSFHFSRPNSSAYWFNLMWIRGKLILTGDGCDMTFTHYQACSSFDAAIKWASESEMDYLLRKADQREEYDADATLQAIIQWANAPVIEALNGTVGERITPYEVDGQRRYRVVHLERAGGYRQICQEYRRAVARGMQDDFWGDVEDMDPRPITRRETGTEYLDMACPVFTDFYDFDPCWENWLNLWRDTLGSDWDPRGSVNTPAIVATHDGRWRIKDELERRLDKTSSRGLDCLFNGSVEHVYSWTYAQKYQFEAIQFACRKIIEAGLVDMTVQVP